MKRNRIFLLAFSACVLVMTIIATRSVADPGGGFEEAFPKGVSALGTETLEIQPMAAGGTYRTHGDRTVLVMRVSFGGESVSAEAAYFEMQRVNEHFKEASYRQFSFREIHVTSSSLALPEPQSVYAEDPTMLWNHARSEARNQGYVSDYDFEIVAYPPIGLPSQAATAAKGAWVEGNFNAGLVAHLLGRNFGLPHAAYWQVVGRDSAGEYPLDNARTVQYGNVFDLMGEPVSMAAGLRNFPANHFSGNFKNILGWLPSHNIHRVEVGQAAGTFRVHRLDGGGPLQHTRRYSLRIVNDGHESLPAPPVKDYWVDFRQLFIENDSAMDGVVVQWGDSDGSHGGSHLLYMGPIPWAAEDELEAPAEDAPLRVGETFADAVNEVIITPVNRGGNSPNEYIDVVVTRGKLETSILSPTPDFSGVNPGGVVRLPESGLIELWASASASGSSLKKVEFVLGGEMLGEAVPVGEGTYVLEISAEGRAGGALYSVATNAAGNTVHSPPVQIEFVETEIEVSAQPEAVIVGETVTFTVSRIAGDGALELVEIFVAGASVGIAGANNRLEWVPEEAGVFDVYSTAFDSNGNKLRTATIQIRVIAIEELMSFVFSATPSTAVIGDPVTLSVTGPEDPLEIESVEFWVDGQAIEVIHEEPFTIEWTPPQVGTYEFIAVVTIQGVSVASPAFSVSVVEPPVPPGLFWISTSSGTNRHLNAVVFFDGQFIAAGEEGTLLRSVDGRDWTLDSVPISTSRRSPRATVCL